jgi:hypothetical protein
MNNVQLSANAALKPGLGIASEILLGVVLLALVYYVKVKLVRIGLASWVTDLARYPLRDRGPDRR